MHFGAKNIWAVIMAGFHVMPKIGPKTAGNPRHYWAGAISKKNSVKIANLLDSY